MRIMNECASTLINVNPCMHVKVLAWRSFHCLPNSLHLLEGISPENVRLLWERTETYHWSANKTWVLKGRRLYYEITLPGGRSLELCGAGELGSWTVFPLGIGRGQGTSCYVWRSQSGKRSKVIIVISLSSSVGSKESCPIEEGSSHFLEIGFFLILLLTSPG